MDDPRLHGDKQYFRKKGHRTTVRKVTMCFFSVFGSELLSLTSAPPCRVQICTLVYSNKTTNYKCPRGQRVFVG